MEYREGLFFFSCLKTYLITVLKSLDDFQTSHFTIYKSSFLLAMSKAMFEVQAFSLESIYIIITQASADPLNEDVSK
jgi:hypothetical protein